MNQKELLIIIPAFNEEENIENVVELLKEKYSQFDYVVVNDGSKDKTADICKEKGYELLDLPVNLGLAGAFRAGMKYAYKKNYSYAIQFDADGQHLPEYIEPMLNKIKEGYDIVIASRFINAKKGKSMRMLGSNLIRLAIRITTGEKIADPTSGMRMFSKAMIEEFAKNLNYGPEPDTVSYLIKNGAKVAEIEAQMAERQFGTSYLGVISSIKYMAKMMTSILIVQNFRKRSK